MELNLRNKVAGISGAASPDGIGFCIAKNLLMENCKVFITDIDRERLAFAQQELSEYGRVLCLFCDMSDEESVKAMFEQAEAELGVPDIWINNAGIYPQKALMDMTVTEWDQLMRINLRSVFISTQNAFARMKEKGGVILNAASYAALIPSAGSGAYAASKAAVLSLTRTLAAELAPYRIRVNAYIPGVIHTGMTQGVIDSKQDALLAQIPLRELGKPQDVANAVLYMVSDAAGYMTGTYMEISGGKLCVQNPDYGYINR